MMETLNATRIGSVADALLHGPERRWAVLASVSKAIYVESDSGDILWVAADPCALHPRAILVSSLPAHLPESGSRCSVGDGCLRVGEDLVVSISAAGVWRSEPMKQERSPLSGLTERAADVLARTAARSPVRGILAGIVLPFVQDHTRSDREPLGEGAVATARDAIASLCDISSGRAVPAGLEEATGLVGLGQGLTPSGDDFLGGFLFTLRTLDSALGDRLEIDWDHVEAWLRKVEGRTNRISFCILADHARGRTAEPLRAFVHAVVGGLCAGRVTQLGERVAGIGHSSGWDMLAGVYCACSAIARILNDPLDGRLIDAGLDQLTSRFQSRKEAARVC